MINRKITGKPKYLSHETKRKICNMHFRDNLSISDVVDKLKLDISITWVSKRVMVWSFDEVYGIFGNNENLYPLSDSKTYFKWTEANILDYLTKGERMTKDLQYILMKSNEFKIQQGKTIKDLKL